MARRKVMFLFGTRPEAIKLAPVYLKLKESGEFEVMCCVTGQHRQMLDQILDLFHIKPDFDLNLMQPNQQLSTLTARAIEKVTEVIGQQKPDITVVQGDTTTVLASALASYYNKVPVAHVEAGLRTYNKYAPYPEEMNRLLTTSLADLHFAPTASARQNLLAENVDDSKIVVTGNTVIDALFYTLHNLKSNHLDIDPQVKPLLDFQGRIILITGHRRENFGDGINNICQALRLLAGEFPEVLFVYPVHLNPNIQGPVKDLLNGFENIRLLHPLDYVSFVSLMAKSYLILTDSGGIQEEGPSLGKPVLVMRENTERPEAIAAGVAKLVSTDVDRIVEETKTLLIDKDQYAGMSSKMNPYGDGKSSERIVDSIKRFLHEKNNGSGH